MKASIRTATQAVIAVVFTAVVGVAVQGYFAKNAAAGIVGTYSSMSIKTPDIGNATANSLATIVGILNDIHAKFPYSDFGITSLTIVNTTGPSSDRVKVNPGAANAALVCPDTSCLTAGVISTNESEPLDIGSIGPGAERTVYLFRTNGYFATDVSAPHVQIGDTPVAMYPTDQQYFRDPLFRAWYDWNGLIAFLAWIGVLTIVIVVFSILTYVFGPEKPKAAIPIAAEPPVNSPSSET